MKKIIIAIVIIISLVLIGAYVLKNNKERMREKTELAKVVNATIPVQVAVTKREALGGSFTATGSFSPSRQVVVSTEAAGKFVNISVDEGRFVQQGQLLARMEYESLEADVKSATANLKKLETDKERYVNLVKTGGVTQAQLDEINLNYINGEARLINARERLKDTYLTAPFAGYVNKRFIENGQYIASGKDAFEIVDLTKMKMVVNVTEDQVLRVNQARQIKVSADVYPDVNYEARVKFVGATADVNLNFPVELQITNVKDKPLRGGMFGRATFELPAAETSLVIPRAALLGSIEKAQVYVVSGDSVMLRAIIIGRLFSNNVEVLNGINEGEKVVASGQINLTEGAKVTILNEN
ncbi:MAG: efflux RND transporter periplasmic adaptor subunit [Bacteroidetes bacterium]|jgi:membrane fusion protein (multidrug efflux system)|nr:efflux RND transporter periplasmic adaptor subunit [Bacteroidota bacterium]